MNVTGKINFFVKKLEGKEKETFTFYDGSLGKKNEDGSYQNARIGIKFSPKFEKKDALEKLVEGRAYVLDISDGFLTFDMYEKNEVKVTKFVVVVNAATLVSSSPVKAKTNAKAKAKAVAQELPF